MHEPYEKHLGYKADFRVKYNFRSPENGGRQTGEPFQGIRCDFSFVDESKNRLHMIWPEFEDSLGNIILNDEIPVPHSGTAKMWIINNEMRPFLYNKIEIGVKGNFREGALLSADCEVIEVLDLKINPTLNRKY